MDWAFIALLLFLFFVRDMEKDKEKEAIIEESVKRSKST